MLRRRKCSMEKGEHDQPVGRRVDPADCPRTEHTTKPTPPQPPPQAHCSISEPETHKPENTEHKYADQPQHGDESIASPEKKDTGGTRW